MSSKYSNKNNQKLQKKFIPLLPSNDKRKITWFVSEEYMYTIVHKSLEVRRYKQNTNHVHNCVQGVSRVDLL